MIKGKIGINGMKLLNKYEETLRITKKLANEIVNRNVIAYSFITDEECLNLCCEEENLNMLLGITLFRDDYDREPLKEEEIKILRESYNINYKEVVC